MSETSGCSKIATRCNCCTMSGKDRAMVNWCVFCLFHFFEVTNGGSFVSCVFSKENSHLAILPSVCQFHAIWKVTQTSLSSIFFFSPSEWVWVPWCVSVSVFSDFFPCRRPLSFQANTASRIEAISPGQHKVWGEMAKWQNPKSMQGPC